MKNTKLFIAAVALAVAGMNSSFAAIEDCGCKSPATRTVVDLTSGSTWTNPYDGSTVTIDANGNLVGDAYLDCDYIFRLQQRTYVQPGHSLTIEPGSIVWGTPTSTGDEDPGAIIVPRDAKIYAVGNKDCPIIFTANGDRNDGSQPLCVNQAWGGILIMGRAYNNLAAANSVAIADGLGSIEGIPQPEPRVYYGANLTGGESFNDNDNSGHIQYVSIRHGGNELGSGNEINGLTLGSVGRKTIISHIEVVSNYDDGIEFFGGTVDVKFAVVMSSCDDYFDWDQGYKGRGQFLYGIQVPNNINGKIGGDNGLEIDGDDNDLRRAGSTLSDPTFSNVTIIGNGSDVGIEAKENTQGRVCNSIFANFSIGIQLDDSRTTDAYHQYNAGNLELFAITLVNNGTDIRTKSNTSPVPLCTDCVSSTTLGWDLSYSFDCDANSVTDALYAIPSTSATVAYSATCVSDDDFFTSVDYGGAFEPGAEPWTKGWTSAESRGFDLSVIDFPYDVDKSGTVGLSDVTAVAGHFGETTRTDND